MEDQRACFERRLVKQLVVVNTRIPRGLFLTDDGRFFIFRYRRVVDCRSCGAMESQVSLVSCLILARLPHEANNIVVAVLLIVWIKDEYGGDNGSNLDKEGIGWLVIFDLKVFSSCFKKRGKFFRRHGVRSGLSAWSWCPIWPIRVC